jgi:N-acetylglucosamine malate deacetylase 1
VHVAFLADGVSSRPGHESDHVQVLATRRAAAATACRILGAQLPIFHDLPDNQLDTIPLLRITKIIEDLILNYEPDTVFTHHGGDLNIDHRRVHQAVVTACRPQPDHAVSTIFFFEVPSSTEWQAPGGGHGFEPNWFEDISSTLEKKLSALDAYAEELRAWPHPRSRNGIEALARWRGATAGVGAAEAFILGRHRN